MSPRRPALPLVLAAALVAAACGSPCQELGDRICNCNPGGVIRDTCKSAVKNQLSASGEPTQEDQNRCQALLATCPDPGDDPTICDALATAQGKARCGLAYPQ